MAIDFGSNPVGTPPTTEQKTRIKTVLAVGSSDIVDSTLAGRSILTAPTSAAQLELIGAEPVGSVAALQLSDNDWAGLQTFGGGYTINSSALYGPLASFTYLGTAAAAHRLALGVERINHVTTALSSYQLNAANSGANTQISFTSASAVTVTIDPNLTYSAAAAYIWNLRQRGAGLVSLSAVGVTVNGHLKMAGQNTSMSVVQAALDTFETEGGVV